MLHKTILALALLATAGQQATPDIDLVGVAPRDRTRQPAAVSTSGGLAWSNTGVSQGHPLTVKLVAANPSGASTLRLDVRILNTGSEPVEIPTDPDLADFEPQNISTPYAYKSLLIFPVAETVQKKFIHFSSTTLYGSQEHPSTLRELAPGESVLIRAETEVKMSSPGENIEIPAGLSVRAEIMVREESVTLHEGKLSEEIRQILPAVLSDNSVEIQE